MSKEEKMVLAIFATVASLWILRGFVSFEAISMIEDSTIAIGGAVLLFILPSNIKKREFLLDWDTAVKIPWGILILFSGGICIASAFVSSGISQIIGDSLAALSGLPILILLASICLSVTFLTEITSNTATTALLMPVLAAAALGADTDPRLLMVPAAMSARTSRWRGVSRSRPFLPASAWDSRLVTTSGSSTVPPRQSRCRSPRNVATSVMRCLSR